MAPRQLLSGPVIVLRIGGRYLGWCDGVLTARGPQGQRLVAALRPGLGLPEEQTPDSAIAAVAEFALRRGEEMAIVTMDGEVL